MYIFTYICCVHACFRGSMNTDMCFCWSVCVPSLEHTSAASGSSLTLHDTVTPSTDHIAATPNWFAARSVSRRGFIVRGREKPAAATVGAVGAGRTARRSSK